jgi:transcriptional regulator with XRE-family HTH domain
MNIGQRLRSIRVEKGLSQGDIERRTGLVRCYISRLENGHTIPVVQTLEKLAQALEMPLYQFLYDGEKPPPRDPILTGRNGHRVDEWGSFGKDARFLRKLQRYLARMSTKQRDILISFAQKVTQRRKAAAARD